MWPVHEWVERIAARYPARTALVTEEGRVRYDQLGERARRAAAVLAELGIAPGDRFGVLAVNVPAFIDLILAAAHRGAILVPLNYRLAAAELAYQVRDSGCRVIFVGREQLPLAEELSREVDPGVRVALDADAVPPGWQDYRTLLAAADPSAEPRGRFDDPLLICYTSGTTGRPKGAVLTQRNMFANAMNAIVPLGLTFQDRFLTLLPLIHIGGIGLYTLPAFLLGATVLLPRRFEPGGALAWIERERATVVMVLPTILKMMVEHPDWEVRDLSSVRFLINGGDRCPMELVERVRARGLRIGGGYGLTESAPTAFLMAADEFEAGTRAPGFMGKPAPFTDARIVDEQGRDCGPGQVGELWLRGENVFAGYWNREDATREAFHDGWFRTGDLAYRDPDGHTFFVARKKEMIKSGGENVYPAEVEAVLAEHPAVAEVCVVGRPDPHWIEVPVAAVVLRPGHRASAEELQAFAAARLARFKVPKAIAFVDALPRTHTGKVIRERVKELVDRGSAPGH